MGWPRLIFSEDEVEEIIFLYKTLTAEEIGKIYGCVKSTISKLLHKHNVKMRPCNSRFKAFAINTDGYVNINGVRRCRMVVEEYLGIKLKHHNVVHHIDGNKSNDNPKNLMPCEDKSYHWTLHLNQMANEKSMKLYNRPDIRTCTRCHRIDVKDNLIRIADGNLKHENCKN